MSEAQFTKTLHSNSLVWAPDGDEAFDDSSNVLQFDIADPVRLIAFKRPDSLVDPASVREVWLSAGQPSANGGIPSLRNGSRFQNIIDVALYRGFERNRDSSPVMLVSQPTTDVRSRGYK